MTRSSLAKTLALATAVTALSAPLVAQATVPGQSQLKGTVTAFDGKYGLHVQTPNGDIDAVALHRGTIINPTGLTLRPGMKVTVLGNETQGTFAANEIDTPYHVRYAQAYAYPNPAFWNPFYGPAFYGGPYLGFGY